MAAALPLRERPPRLLACRPRSRSAAVPNAHTSALRAVWTNGHRAFSTGLDQRVRCWRLAAEPGESARPDSPGAGAPPGGALGGAAGCSAGDAAAAGAAALGGGRGGSSNGTADAGSGSGGDWHQACGSCEKGRR